MSNAAGIDVSKAHPDAVPAAGPARRFHNDDSGIGALPECLESRGAGKAVYEPADGYELPLAAALRPAGLSAHRSHPNWMAENPLTIQHGYSGKSRNRRVIRRQDRLCARVFGFRRNP